MSNTSLVPIKIPKLNSSNFGQSIMQAFQNIDLNFQKLANLDVNQGAPGRSCVYVPIHLGAAFVYEAYDVNDTAHSTYYNAFQEWKTWFGELEKKHGDAWRNFLQEVDNAYKQYNEVTGKSKQEYARLACILLWGNPSPFGFGSVPVPGSLTAVLHDHYGNIDGGANVEFPDGEAYKLYGDWLYELYRFNPVGSTTIPETNRGQIREVIREYCRLFSIHFGIVGIGKIVMALSPDMVYSSYHPVGSFEYWYVDPRYRCGVQPSGESTTGDISCILRWVTDTYETGNNVTWDGHFEILEIFPTIRVGDNGEYHWHINGMDTGIPVQGVPGRDGKSTQMLVVERVENVRGWHPTKYPNGQDFWSPKSGPQTFRMLNYSGVPDRVRTQFQSALVDNMPILRRVAATDIPTADKVIISGYDRTADYTGRVTQFSISEDKGWLSEKADEQTKNIAEIGYLFRIFRIVGREKFYKYDETPLASVMAIDEYGHDGDPSCDYFYFNRENVSRINDDQPTQELIKSLDGALAIVLPGPAYKHDRTDTAFWFATLRAVKTDVENVFELVAYCSPHAQQTTQLDEHSQAGMMQSFDAYTHKSTSDNRNKPRGLMLPIGSVLAATGNASDTWAAHIIHSDTGGFINRIPGGDCRGVQNIKVTDGNNKAFTGGVGRLENNIGEDFGRYDGQFTEVINKRILHIGSVNDYRALNYVEDNAGDDDTFNGAVPGRKATGDEGNLIGTANFFGEINDNGWFIGTELHVDEPVTITRYRDLKPKGRLLDVEGDVVIGPHTHKNIPDIKYRYRTGGLMVASTLSLETLDDANLVNDNELIFPKGLLTGDIQLKFEPFIKSVKALSWGIETDKDGDVNNSVRNSRDNVWKGKLARLNGSHGLRPNAGTNKDGAVLKGAAMQPQGVAKRDNPLFSGVFDDTIGARMMLVTDGFGIYNPMDIGEVDAKGNPTNVKIPFSVDAFGNIQTYGREIRSNADDAAWYFHTRWPLSISGQGDDTYVYIGGVKTAFVPPKRNMLTFASDHEINFAAFDLASDVYNSRYWRTSNNPSDDYKKSARIKDPTDWVSGYYHSFGFTDESGRSKTTFPHGGLVDNANIFGANEYLPTVLSLPADLAYMWGGFVSRGLNPRAFMLDFDGLTPMARFGGTIRNGLVIAEPARSSINANDKSGITYAEYMGDPLNVTYRGDRYLGDDMNVDSHIDTCGCDMINMFNRANEYTNNVNIGIWNRHGMVVEKTMIVGEDLLGYRGLSIRGQSRSKSFRRHIPSAYFEDNLKFRDDGLIRDQEKAFAFLLDNGWSSTPAPQISDPKTLFDAHLRSPLVLDLGEAYGSSRLIKFGQIGTIDLDAETFDLNIDNENMRDYSTALFGWNPTASMYKYGVRCDSLFKNFKPGGRVVNGFEVNALCNALWAQVSITIDLNAKSLSRDKYTDNWIKFIGTNETHTTAFGIVLPDTVGSYRTGNIGHNHYYNAYEVKNDPTGPEIEFDGFNWKEIFTWTKKELKNGKWESVEDTSHLPFPKPMYNVDVFVGAAFQGSTKCNWYPTGTNSSRDRQFGALFRLTPNGKFTMPYYMHPEALTTEEGQTITISFTYPVAPATMLTRYVTAKSATYTSDKTSITGPFEHLEDSPLSDKNPDNTWKCFWYKKYSGFDSRYGGNTINDAMWRSIKWVLWKSHIEESTAYYTSPRAYVDANGLYFPGKVKSGDSKQIESLINSDETFSISTDGIQEAVVPNTNPAEKYDETLIDETDPTKYYNKFVNKDRRCLWRYTKSTDYYGTVQHTWSLIYEYDPTTKSSGQLFGQRTDIGLLGYKYGRHLVYNPIVRHHSGSDYFKSSGSKKIQSGVFKNFKSGKFADWNVDPNNPDSNFVVSGNVPANCPSNMFSVMCWETGGMAYAKLSVVLDKEYDCSGYGREKMYGLFGGSNNWKVSHNVKTYAWLPVGAKLPKFPVSAYFGGMSHMYDTDKDMDQSGALWLRLEQDGQVTIPFAYASRGLIQGRGTNQDWPDEPQILEVIFEYQPSDKKMADNHYGDEVDESGEMAHEDGAPDVPGGDPPQVIPSTVESTSNWTWDSNINPTATTLAKWLKTPALADLKEQLDFAQQRGEKANISSPYGYATIECVESSTVDENGNVTNIGKKQVALWVASNTTNGSGLTYRAITFKWDGTNATNLHTVLLEKNFNPGYYESNGTSGDGKSPSDDVSYIGTTNNGGTGKSYVWYTNNGETWEIIKQPVVLDPNYVYVLSTDNSNYYDVDGRSVRTPAGILATFSSDEDVRTYVGSENYVPIQSLVPVNGDGNWVNNATTRDVMERLNGVAGKFKPVQGFTQLWRVAISNWTPAGRKVVTNWEKVDTKGLIPTGSWFQLSKTFVDPALAIPLSCQAFWMKKTGTNLPNKPFEPVSTEWDNNLAVSIRHNEFINGPNNPEKHARRIENWFAIALNYFLINYRNDPEHPTWQSRKYAMFTEDTGWGSQWDSLSIFQEHNGVLYVNIANETHIDPPTTVSTGSDPIPSLRCEWHADIQQVWGSIKGKVIVKYGKFDRSNVDAPPGYTYLCSEYGIQGYSSSALSSGYVEKMSLPAILSFEADLIFQYNGELYRIVITDKKDGTPVIFTKTKIGGDASEAAYDDSALVSRISALEGKSHDKPGNATSTSDGLMSKDDKAKLDGLGTGGDYELPTASSSTKGGIKVGSGLSMTGDTMSVKTVSATQNGLMTKEDKSTLDDLAGRVAALEAMIIAIQESPLAINLAMPAGDTSVQLNLSGTDVNGNDVNFNVENNSDSDITVS